MKLVVVTLLTLAGVRCEYKGRYTRNIKDYDVVIPKKITKEGSFISYYLPHYYNIARVKRGVDSGIVHYVVPIEGEDKILELEPSGGFQAPGMVVEYHPVDARWNLSSIKMKKPRPTRCHYHGKIRDDPRSSVAITACSGLAGSIKTGAIQYLIEPVDDEGKPTVDVKHKHLLYKISQLYSNRSKCGTTGSFATAFKQRMEWEEKYGKEVEASMKGEWEHDKPLDQLHDEHFRERRAYTTCDPDESKCHEHCSMPHALFLELLVVVGPRVASSKYLTNDVEQFVNTIVNIAVKQFQDSTIGKPIVVKLVRIITVDYLFEELDAKKNNPQKILQHFCKWQLHFNPRMEEHPNHHDYAIYIVKFEICQGEILGLTNMASMCRPDKSCAVVSEEGLLTGNIITHMIGHALGAEHDDSSTSSCAPVEPDGTTYHMGIDICGISSSWSVCSKQCISQFVKTHAGWCLTDVPTSTDLTYPILLPGQIYSAAEQCRINFELESYACLVGEFCKRLYCRINDKECISMGDPPAQGTQCGPNLWCFNGKCVHRGSRPGATNGEWGEWSPWSPCTKTCGGGIQTADRACDAPAPAHGGKMCPGKWLKSKMCNIGVCPDAGKGFLDLQCEHTNNRMYRGRKHSWMYFNQQIEDLQCVVVCVNEMNEIAVRSPMAIDGTYCKPASKDVCIRGSCKQVGCDWGIESQAKEDACGVCHGNGTECRIMQGFFGEHNVQGIVEFLKLPIGTSMVLVRETRPTPCFFFIAHSMNHSFYLNSDREEQLFFTGTFYISGAVGVYQIKGDMERIFIKEPLAVPITISSVCPEEENTLGVLYQYALPEANSPAAIPTYTWEFLAWEACPFPCGGGAQRAIPVCVEAQGGEVEDCYCSPQARPPDKVRVCNKHACEAKWWVGPWASCDCFHQEGVTTRLVMCANLKEARSALINIVPEEQCNPNEKPRIEKSCDPNKERELWEKKGWTKRDITDIIPYSEAAEDYTVWNDVPEKYPSMFNVRIMLHQLDPERVNDYLFLKKIGLTSSQWQKIHNGAENSGFSSNRLRVRRRRLVIDPSGKMKRIFTTNKPKKGFAIISHKKSVTEPGNATTASSRSGHKGVKVIKYFQVDRTAKPPDQEKSTCTGNIENTTNTEAPETSKVTTEEVTTTEAVTTAPTTVKEVTTPLTTVKEVTTALTTVEVTTSMCTVTKTTKPETTVTTKATTCTTKHTTKSPSTAKPTSPATTAPTTTALTTRKLTTSPASDKPASTTLNAAKQATKSIHTGKGPVNKAKHRSESRTTVSHSTGHLTPFSMGSLQRISLPLGGTAITTHKSLNFLKIAAAALSATTHLPLPDAGDPNETSSDMEQTLEEATKDPLKRQSGRQTCLPPDESEGLGGAAEIDFLNTSNIRIYVVPLMTTIRTIIQNDQEYVLLDTLAKWPVADEMGVVEHWGNAARHALRVAKDKASIRTGKKSKNIVADD